MSNKSNPYISNKDLIIVKETEKIIQDNNNANLSNAHHIHNNDINHNRMQPTTIETNTNALHVADKGKNNMEGGGHSHHNNNHEKQHRFGGEDNNYYNLANYFKNFLGIGGASSSKSHGNNSDQSQEDDKNKMKQKGKNAAGVATSIIQTAVLTFAIVYNLVWAIIFASVLSKYSNNETCDTIRRWDTALFIFYFVLVAINLIFLLLNMFITDNAKLAKVTAANNIRACFTGIGSFVILIGISASYGDLSMPSFCGDGLATLNLLYIIIEWIIVGFVLAILLCMVFNGVVLAKYRKDGKI